MPLTLTQVATRCGVDKSTARRWVRTGAISGTRDDAGTWFVEECELLRFKPDAAASPTEPTSAVKLHAPGDAAAAADNRTTDVLVAELRAVISDLRQDRDHWRDAFEAAQRQLPKPEQPPRWSWRWLRTAG